MTRSETIKIMGELSIAYPRNQIFGDAGQIEAAAVLWHEMFADMPFEVVQVAVRKLMLESQFPPTIADVRARVAEISHPSSNLGVDEAWAIVWKAIKRHGWCNEKQALASMPPNIAKLIHGMGWYDICMSENIDVVRGQFRHMYEAMQNRERKSNLLPPKMRDAIGKIGEFYEGRSGLQPVTDAELKLLALGGE